MKRNVIIRSLRNPLTRVSGLRRSQPIRIVSLVLVLIWLIPACTCAAAEDCYTVYTPRAENSSVFYIDVYSRREITAAVFELRFSDDTVSYYSVVASDSAATVRDRLQEEKVTTAFADSTAVSGKLCRFSFKALKTGTVTFTLHMQQASDADHLLISGWEDHTLTVKLGKDDVVADSTVRRTERDPSGASTAASGRGAGKSELTPGGDDGSDSATGAFDLRRDDKLRWVLIGAGIPVLIGSLIWIGILIGRKSKDKEKKEVKPGEELPERDESSDPSDEKDNNS